MDFTKGAARILGPAAQPISFLFLWFAMMLFALGYSWSVTPLENRWKLYRSIGTYWGRNPQRGVSWKRKARMGTWMVLAIAVVLMGGSGWVTYVAAIYKVDLRPVEVRTR